MIPKFRVWEHDVKFMNDQVRITYNRFGGNKIFVKVTDGFGWKDVDEKYLMQSTGLHDKNSKEIYEGDVIRIVHPFRGRTHIGEVIKEAYTYNVKDFYFSHYDIPGDAFSEGTEYMEVIGNVHEHPELLIQPNE